MGNLEEIENDKFSNMNIATSEKAGNKLVLLVKDIICRFKDNEDLLTCIRKGVVLK